MYYPTCNCQRLVFVGQIHGTQKRLERFSGVLLLGRSSARRACAKRPSHAWGTQQNGWQKQSRIPEMDLQRIYTLKWIYNGFTMDLWNGFTTDLHSEMDLQRIYNGSLKWIYNGFTMDSLEHHPTIGDLISNRYLCWWSSKSPKRDIMTFTNPWFTTWFANKTPFSPQLANCCLQLHQLLAE